MLFTKFLPMYLPIFTKKTGQHQFYFTQLIFEQNPVI